ncbi:hypothetical protein [Nitrosovibrio sp. Nv4]|uniref:hypothetical protein n=1 Tax=Nitrosovibrio sp. Nv4 TaxID=1945880 RepID=UPI000BCC8AA9|nr:hypothetical protein [Nitrosovibrio sp. Nv4]SOD41607.1 hypothetical protein SAMN06298226_1909 [Nitrosovibrio sp. Nv4]
MESFKQVEEQSDAIRLVPGPWSHDAEYWLGRVDQDATLADLKRQSEAGLCQVVYVERGGAVAGAVLLRIDVTSSGPQGVMVAAAGALELMPVCMPYLEKMFQGVSSIRIHTARPGLVRKLTAMGYKPTEMVLRKEVVNG